MRDQYVCSLLNAANGFCVTNEAELQITIQKFIAQLRRSDQAERVPIGCRSNDGFKADVAGGSSPVFHDERTTQLFGKPVGDQACVDVIPATGRKPDDQAYRTIRISLRLSNARYKGHRKCAGRDLQ